MRCLFCHEDICKDLSVWELLVGDDVLCGRCRHQWIRNRKVNHINGVEVRSSYVYNEAFAKVLIQYKECFDEALYPVFLWPERFMFRIRYHGYTLVPVPSSLSKVEERGFDHVEQMFRITGLPIKHCLEKIDEGSQKERGALGRMRMEHGFRLKEGVRLPEKILLVDDVCTSGNSIRGCLAVLGRRKGIKVYTVATHPLNV